MIELKQSYIDAYIKYLFTLNPRNSLKLSIAAGLNGSKVLLNNNTTYSTSFGDITIVRENSIQFKNFHMSPIIGFHLSYSKLEFIANYTMPQEMCNFQDGYWRTSRLAANLFYNFNLK